MRLEQREGEIYFTVLLQGISRLPSNFPVIKKKLSYLISPLPFPAHILYFFVPLRAARAQGKK